MSRAALPMLLVVLAYSAFEVSMVARSQHLFEPLRIFDDFVAAGHAAERCEGGSAEERTRFDRNFAAVRRQAIDDLAEQSPDESRSALEAQIDARQRERQGAVDRLVADEGCSGSEVWQLLKLHEQRARLRVR